MNYNLDLLGDNVLPDVSIIIGGKTRKLAFDFNAIVRVEKLTGINLLTDSFSADFSTLGAIFYAALLHDDPSISLETVQGWITFKTAPIIYEAIMSAWIGSIPDPKDDSSSGEEMATEEPVA